MKAEDFENDAKVYQPVFTENDKHRLRELNQQFEVLREERRKFKKLPQWRLLLGCVGAVSCCLIFWCSHGKGFHNIFDYLLIPMAIVSAALFLLVFRWQNQIDDAAWEEFCETHGNEYRELTGRKQAFEKKTYSDKLR